MKNHHLDPFLPLIPILFLLPLLPLLLYSCLLLLYSHLLTSAHIYSHLLADTPLLLYSCPLLLYSHLLTSTPLHLLLHFSSSDLKGGPNGYKRSYIECQPNKNFNTALYSHKHYPIPNLGVDKECPCIYDITGTCRKNLKNCKANKSPSYCKCLCML